MRRMYSEPQLIKLIEEHGGGGGGGTDLWLHKITNVPSSGSSVHTYFDLYILADTSDYLTQGPSALGIVAALKKYGYVGIINNSQSNPGSDYIVCGFTSYNNTIYAIAQQFLLPPAYEFANMISDVSQDAETITKYGE